MLNIKPETSDDKRSKRIAYHFYLRFEKVRIKERSYKSQTRRLLYLIYKYERGEEILD